MKILVPSSISPYFSLDSTKKGDLLCRLLPIFHKTLLKSSHWRARKVSKYRTVISQHKWMPQKDNHLLVKEKFWDVQTFAKPLFLYVPVSTIWVLGLWKISTNIFTGNKCPVFIFHVKKFILLYLKDIFHSAIFLRIENNFMLLKEYIFLYIFTDLIKETNLILKLFFFFIPTT